MGKKYFGGSIYAWIFIGGVAALVIYGYRSLKVKHDRVMASNTSTVGVVYKIERGKSDIVHMTYEVDGKRWQGKDISHSNGEFERANGIRFAVGDTMRVYYEAADPTNIALNRESWYAFRNGGRR